MLASIKIIIFLAFIFFHGNEAVGSGKGGGEEAKGKSALESGNKASILLLADGLGTHYNFALNMANILARNGYKVHFVAVKYGPVKLTEPDKAVNFVPVQFEKDEKYENLFERMEMSKFIESQTTWGKPAEIKEVEKNFFKMLKFNMFSFFKAIIEDEKTFEWLKKEKFDLGIAEFCISTGAFALFNEIGLANYIATTAAPPFPAIEHFLDLKILADVPERFSAKRGDGNNKSGIREHNSKRRNDNIAEYRRSMPEYIKLYKEEYKEIYDSVSKLLPENVASKVTEKVRPMSNLLREARYFLVNQHQIARFPVETGEHVQFIGGLDVETAGIIPQKHNTNGNKKHFDFGSLKWILEVKCLVVFSLGTQITFDNCSGSYIQIVQNAMAKHKECNFLVRTNRVRWKEVMPEQPENVFLVGEPIPQQEILALDNVRAFIHHCGQNTSNEVIYAGVPFICIPFFGDQPLNTAIAEFMGIGIWVEHKHFEAQFSKALDQLLLHSNGGNSYLKMAKDLAKTIHGQPKSQQKKFLDIVEKAINMEKIKVDEHTKIVEFATILKKYQTAKNVEE